MKDFHASEYAKSELESILKDMHEKEDSTYDAYCTDYKLQAIQAWYLADIASTLADMGKDIPACLVDIWREI